MGGVSVAQNRIVPEFQLLTFTSPGKGDQKYLHFQILVKPNQMANFPALDPTFRGFLGVALPREKFLKDGPQGLLWAVRNLLLLVTSTCLMLQKANTDKSGSTYRAWSKLLPL